MKRSGTADLPLHGGRVPAWLANRMTELGTAIAEQIVLNYGPSEFLTRLSDPFWFQAYGPFRRNTLLLWTQQAPDLTRSSTLRSTIAAMPISNSIQRVALLFIVVAAVRSFAAAGKSTSLSDARSAIEANLKTPEGKAFEDRMGKEFLAKHMDQLRQCKSSAGGDTTNFWILFNLDKDGAVEEILLHPETKLGTCARDAYLKDKLLPPPHPDYWFGVYLQLSH